MIQSALYSFFTSAGGVEPPPALLTAISIPFFLAPGRQSETKSEKQSEKKSEKKSEKTSERKSEKHWRPKIQDY